jgi:hypothetical protein
VNTKREKIRWGKKYLNRVSKNAYLVDLDVKLLNEGMHVLELAEVRVLG